MSRQVATPEPSKKKRKLTVEDLIGESSSVVKIEARDTSDKMTNTADDDVVEKEKNSDSSTTTTSEEAAEKTIHQCQGVRYTSSRSTSESTYGMV